MLDSVRNRWLIAFGAAVVVGLGVTTLFSVAGRRAQKRSGDAAAVWKARTGVDLSALPRIHPSNPDSDEARALDVVLQPIGLQLGARSFGLRQNGDRLGDREDLDALGDALRDAMRSETTDVPKLSPAVVAAIERRSNTLDAVADYVAGHDGIRWLEEFGPRPRVSRLYTTDHLTLHRLLIGRAFLALEREDKATAVRMLSTSRALQRVLETRQELWSQFVAIGIERMHLALIRYRGGAIGVPPATPAEGSRERFVRAMSAEAVVVLANARRDPFTSETDDGPDRVMRVLAGPKIKAAASEAIRFAAEGVDEVRRSPDGCAELTKVRPRLRSFFMGDFFTMNATEAWHRFIALELDRAITAAVLTGQTTSPCPSVTITVRDEGQIRTVTSKGLPPESDNVVRLPAVVTTRK